MTKPLLTHFLGGMLAALVLLATGWASAEEARPHAYVVLVGINQYADDQIKPKPHAEVDARALYKVLTDKAHQDGHLVHARLLLGKPGEEAKPATKANILDALTWISKEAGEKDLVLFGFLGQGAPLGKSGSRRCYFASDSTFEGRGKNALAEEEIAEAWKALKSKQVACFLDVNFKGFKAPKEAVAEPSLGTTPYAEFLGEGEDQEHLGKPGRVVYLATNGLDPSLDLDKHGVFAQVLLAGLDGAADQEGYEPDGRITVDEMRDYLRKEVAELARTHGKTIDEKSQRPFTLGTRESDFVLLFNPAVLPRIHKQQKALADLAKAGKVPERFAKEGKELLSRMPRLEAQRKLRQQYQKLVEGEINLAKFESERESILASTRISRTDALAFGHKVLEAVQIIHDGYVKPTEPGEMVSWAIQGLFEYAREAVPDKLASRLKKVKDMGEAELGVLLADARQELGIREDLNDQKDLNVSLQRMLSHLDPYTTYIDPEMKERFKIDVQGHFTGIGIQIRKDAVTDQLLVVTPIKGAPAYKAGLLTGDLITTIKRVVDSKGTPLDKPEIIPTKGLPLTEAVKKILGLEGTKVTLTIKREGTKEPFDVTIARGPVEVESVLGYQRKRDTDWDFMIDPENKIGYVRLTSFARNTYRDLRAAVGELEKQGMRGFILDLRFNPGGLLNSAIEISDLFVDDGVIVSIRPRDRREARFRGEHRGSMLDFPMVCLVNGGSASGSEIVSACLQDHNRAQIIGERSYGKGSVQNIQEFEKGDIKLTTATFWRPSGRNLNKSSTKGKKDEDWGVIPDKTIELTRKEREDLAEHQRETEIIQRPDKPVKKSDFKDRQLESALDYLRGQIRTASRFDRFDR
jgi:carboxyl-terminal processing protease